MPRLTGFQHTLFIQLLEPSIGGTIGALIFAIAALIIGRLPSLSHQLDMLYIPQAIDNIRHDIGHAILALLTHSLHGYADNFFLVLFWIFIGVIMYALLRGLAAMFLDLEVSLEERDFLWPSYADPNKEVRAFIAKAGFRLSVFILLLAYFLIVVPKVLHGLNSLLDRGGDQLQTGLHSLWFLVVACLLAQGFVVLFRLLALRTRLF